MLLILVYGTIFFVSLIYGYYLRLHSRWAKKNVPFIEPSIPFGNLGNFLTRKEHIALILKHHYDTMKARGAKHAGLYGLTSATYLPIDLDLIKNIMARDFAYWTDRGTSYDEKREPLSAHLFSLEGTRWKNLRAKLTPTFTSGKMKTMFGTLVECGKIFKEFMDKEVDADKPIDIKEDLGRFTTDVIGSCAFGLECESISNDESPFRKHGKAIFEPSRLRSILGVLAFICPRVFRLLRLRTIPKDVEDFFIGVVRDTVTYREESNFVRNDFMQILINLKNNQDSEAEGKHDGKTLTLNEIAAQCFVFFLAGFETSSTAMSFALLELSRNQEIQKRVREEINRVLNKHGGEVTYEAINEMSYLQQVVDETLRLYPPVTMLMRKCVQDYEVPGMDLVLEKGTLAFLPVYAIHMDEEYYPNPKAFEPDRFAEENKKKRHPYAFIPFGEGPRICIGMRFGLMQTKVGLAMLLKNYRFTVDEKTKLPITFARNAFLTTAEGGIWLRAQHV